MTATATAPEVVAAPGPLTLATGRLGRALGANVRTAMKGDELALELNGKVVITKAATREGAVKNMTALLNEVASLIERSRQRQAPPQHPALTSKIPEAKAPVGPSVKRIG